MFLVLYLYIGLWEYLIQKAGATNDEDWYSVTKVEGVEGWVELRDHKRSVKLNLTSQYMAFMNQSLTFQFPFYGEDFREVKITTQGFISLSDVISDTQYIAPLMADFKPLPTNNPTQDIRVLYNSDSVIIQWASMLLAKQSSVGEFTFQLRLDVTGTINMLYQTVPLEIEEIQANDHAVTAGISGGHAEGQTIPIPYDTISLTNITSNSTYILNPVATCLDQMNCSACTSWSSMCYWCEAIQQCSTGQDRLKDKWLQNGCHPHATQECSGRTSTPPRLYGTTTHPFSTFSMTSASPGGSTETGVETLPTTAPHTTHQGGTGQSNVTVNKNYTIDNKPEITTAKPGHITTAPEKAPISLPIIYIILIVASSLSFLLVVSAFIILLWHKRRLNLHSSTLTSQTNNLLSNGGANGHENGVKCLSDGLSHI